MTKRLFYLFYSLYFVALIYLAWSTPISPHEAKIFYGEYGIVSFLMHQGHELLDSTIFGEFMGIRIFFLFIGQLSLLLYYRMTWIYLQQANDRYLATAVYALLPGMVTASVLANISILVIPLVLIFLLAFDKKWVWLEIASMLLLFMIHEASVIFFIATFLYGLIEKERILAWLSGAFLILSIVAQKGVDIGGVPSGHFADIFGIYATLFSPLLFIYFFYALYRIFLREKKNLLWYISFTALIASLLLSIRQQISLTDFAPYVIVSVVLMLDIFNRTLRVRLPEYQKRYKIGFAIVIASLLLVSSSIIFHKTLFIFFDNPEEHFAYRLYRPYKLAQELKSKNMGCFDTQDKRLSYQLRFYNIAPCHQD